MIDTPLRPADIAAQAARSEAQALCERLKPDERETLILLCKGLTLRQTAKATAVPMSVTVYRMERVRRVLGVNKAIEAAVIATKAGLV